MYLFAKVFIDFFLPQIYSDIHLEYINPDKYILIFIRPLSIVTNKFRFLFAHTPPWLVDIINYILTLKYIKQNKPFMGVGLNY